MFAHLGLGYLRVRSSDSALDSHFGISDIGSPLSTHFIQRIGIGSRVSASDLRPLPKHGHDRRHERSREAAEKSSPWRKPWVSSPGTTASPEGAKENVAYVWKHLVAFHLLDGSTALIINGANDHVHRLIRVRPVHSAAEIARCTGQCLRLGAGETFGRIYTADGLRCFQPERIELGGSDEIYRGAGRASQEADVSRGVCGVFAEESCGVRSAIYMG